MVNKLRLSSTNKTPSELGSILQPKVALLVELADVDEAEDGESRMKRRLLGEFDAASEGIQSS